MVFWVATQYKVCSTDQFAVDEIYNLSNEIIVSIKSILPAVQYRTAKNASLERPAWMLSNGGKISLEKDYVIELSTPETTSPSACLKYIKAMEKILIQAFSVARQKRESAKSILLIKQSMHSNFSVDKFDLISIRGYLLPFVITRNYSYSGGFMNGYFIIPNTPLLEQDILDLQSRPLVRLNCTRHHINFGGAIMGDIGLFLTIGTTAMIIKMLNDGCCVGGMYRLDDPIQALKKLRSDFSWQVPLELETGLIASPLEIQRHYLKAAEIYSKLKKELWMEVVVRLWKEILDLTEKGDSLNLSSSLDAWIKLKLHYEYLKHKGMSFEEFSRWGGPIGLAKEFFPHGDIYDVRGYLSRTMPYATFKLLEDSMRHDLLWEDLLSISKLYDQVHALDIRFNEIGPDGIYHRMYENGFISQQNKFVDERDLQLAQRIPPQDTRACGRGTAIREVANIPDSYANWLIVEAGNRSAKFENCLDTTCSWQISPIPPKKEVKRR